MEIIGLLTAIGLLMYLAYKGFHLFPTTVLVSILVLLTSGMGIWTGLTEGYASAFGGFVTTYCFVLIFGAIFGQIMSDTGCAKAISNKIISLAGLRQIILITILVTSLLAYGGLATFVIIFTVYPITKGLFEPEN